MVRHNKPSDIDKIKTLANIAKNDKDQLDELCREFDMIDPKSHKAKFTE